jgi:uncharacterized protein YfaT (DUF1175 family)
MSALQLQLKKLQHVERNTGDGRRQASFLYSKEEAAKLDFTTVSVTQLLPCDLVFFFDGFGRHSTS